MAPKQKLKSDKKTKSSAKKASKKPSKGRSKNAYLYFSTSQRAQILRRECLEDVPANFVAAAKALSTAWKELDDAARAPFEACAVLDRCRRDIESMRGASLREAGIKDLAPAVKAAVEALGNTPSMTGFSCASEAAGGLIEAMENLDSRLSVSGRAAAVSGIRAVGASALGAPAVTAAAAALGSSLGGRLAALIRKWSAVPASRATVAGTPRPAKPTRSTVPAAAIAGGQPTVPSDAGALNDETRSRVVGMLMRTAAQGAGKASFPRCCEVERALFARFGSDTKEYRRRARMLTHNLGASDGALLHRVLNGTLTAKELVRLEAEDLASDALKAERQAERERYFQGEVKLTAGPPKRRRDLYMPRQADNPEEPDGHSASPGPASRLDGEVKSARETQNLAAHAEPVCKTQSTQSSSSSSSSDEEEDSIESQEPVPVMDAELDHTTAPAHASSASALVEAEASPVQPLACNDTTSDELLARIMQAASPSRSSSSSSSSSRSASPERPDKSAGSSCGAEREQLEQAWLESQKLQQLLDMGFEEGLARAALDAANGNVKAAVRFLLEQRG
eukprot:TRINITY_DN63777_c0_g1_i1.p1 TRINITY_DN63777_c0_g1~~TRINITY_DN63777_c0_g1_i1.p1  ORF type:complete len:577 (+),score=139.60 TRINITY_DN63777_c0_g1_i1:36-1733(+)